MIDRLLPWFALKSVPGIGNILFKRLIDRFKTPEAVFAAGAQELAQVEGISLRLAAFICKHKIPDFVKQDLELVLQRGYKIITLNDSDYPDLLHHIPDPPPYLYVFGDIRDISKPVAVVGSRNATRYGILTTKRLCADLAIAGITIISGMARGIDTAAHIGALSAGKKTIAVLGSGLDRVYPHENLKLFHQIAENGAVISEFHLSAPPEAQNFPIRNRIISGISLGTVVVEASKKSGSLITARLALEQNRDVFAVPGNIYSFKSCGTHSLIKQGAKLVEDAQDILEEISPNIGNRKIEPVKPELPPLTPEESLVFSALSSYPIHIDELTRKISMEPGKLSSILLQLELKGIIQQSPGKLFSV